MNQSKKPQTSLAIRLEGRLELLNTLGQAAARLDRLLAAAVLDGKRLQLVMDEIDRLAGAEPEFLESCAAFERFRESAVSVDLATFHRARQQWKQLHDEIRRLVPPERRTSLAGDWAHLRSRLPGYVALKRELAAFTRRSPGLRLGTFSLWRWSMSNYRLCLQCEGAGVETRLDVDEGCAGCGRTTRSIAAEMDQLLGWPARR